MPRGWHINNGYRRYHSGPNRGKYVHRVRKEKELGRKLKKDEDVHHRDRRKLNNKIVNLQVLGKSFHGWVSSKQRWFMNWRDEKERQQWEEYFAGTSDNPNVSNQTTVI